MKMEFTAEILRGWPNDGAIERVELIKSGDTLVNGDVVVKHTDGSITKVGTSADGKVGLVIRGNGDSSSVVAAGNRAVVLWGNYIAKVSNYNTASLPTAWAPGVAVTGGGTGSTGKFNTTTATDSTVIGHCLNVIASSTTETASVVIAVK